MRPNIARKLTWLLAATLAVVSMPASAQTRVTFNLPAFNYDVIYLSDFINVTSDKLSNNIPNFTGTILADSNGIPISVNIILDAEAWIQLKGASNQELVRAETEPFVVNGSKSISATDLAGGSSDIVIKGGADYYENEALKQQLTDYAKQFPTAPVGQYTLVLTAYPVTPSGAKGSQPLGSIQKVITVRNASPDEVQVNLIEPQPGEVISTTLPTFSWSSSYPNVTLYVYEMLPIYQSMQEAVTGIPYLKQDISGAQTFTYPVNAARRLEQDKSYVWFVEASVITNRQTVEKQSEIRLFRIQTNNQANQEITDMMNNFGGTAAGTFATLQSMGWIPTGTITLDGKPLTLDDLKALVAKLTAENIQVTVHVE